MRIDLSDQLQLITPQYIQAYLRAMARVEVSLVDAAALVPLVRGQKAAFAPILKALDVVANKPTVDGLLALRPGYRYEEHDVGGRLS